MGIVVTRQNQRTKNIAKLSKVTANLGEFNKLFEIYVSIIKKKHPSLQSFSSTVLKLISDIWIISKCCVTQWTSLQLIARPTYGDQQPSIVTPSENDPGVLNTSVPTLFAI